MTARAVHAPKTRVRIRVAIADEGGGWPKNLPGTPIGWGTRRSGRPQSRKRGMTEAAKIPEGAGFGGAHPTHALRQRGYSKR
jgi:hypothetical protein